jgi:type I restriction enzyme S subunit
VELISGWDAKPLGEFITFQRGFDLPHRLRVHGDVPVVSYAGVTDYNNEARVGAPGVVTGRYGTIGEVFLLRDHFGH